MIIGRLCGQALLEYKPWGLALQNKKKEKRQKRSNNDMEMTIGRWQVNNGEWRDPLLEFLIFNSSHLRIIDDVILLDIEQKT